MKPARVPLDTRDWSDDNNDIDLSQVSTGNVNRTTTATQARRERAIQEKLGEAGKWERERERDVWETRGKPAAEMASRACNRS